MRPCNYDIVLLQWESDNTAYLRDDVLVREAHNHAVLGRVVLVLILDHQETPGLVVGLPLASALEPDLVALEVRLTLDHLHKLLAVKWVMSSTKL